MIDDALNTQLHEAGVVTRHLLDVTDFTAAEIATILDLAEQPIDVARTSARRPGAALIFEKPSNRTRHSMEMAVVQLGGHPVYTRGEEVGFDTREPVEDVVRIMEGYHSLIAARVFDHATVTRAPRPRRRWHRGPGRQHALRPLASAAGVRRCAHDAAATRRARPARPWPTWATTRTSPGRSPRSRCCSGCTSGSAVRVASTPTRPNSNGSRLIGTGTIEQVTRAVEAVEGANAVHTDTWVSMGQEDEKAASDAERSRATRSTTT